MNNKTKPQQNLNCIETQFSQNVSGNNEKHSFNIIRNKFSLNTTHQQYEI